MTPPNKELHDLLLSDGHSYKKITISEDVSLVHVLDILAAVCDKLSCEALLITSKALKKTIKSMENVSDRIRVISSYVDSCAKHAQICVVFDYESETYELDMHHFPCLCASYNNSKFIELVRNTSPDKGAT